MSLLCIMTVAVLAVPVSTMSAAAPPPKTVTYNMYFGDLHTHTIYSDGYEGTPWDAFAMASASGADFMALTDHATLWNAYSAWVLSPEEWEDTLAAAEYYTSDSFVALTGYEAWMLGNLGEVNVYNVPYLPPLAPMGYKWDRLPNFYDWVSKQPGAVAQFNHPLYVSDNFEDFAFLTDARDAAMGVVEVWNGELTEDSYIMALDAGWHLMPSANSDTHYADWMSSEIRTVLLAPSLTAADLYAAIGAGRGYATMDKNLEISYTLNGQVMGSVLQPDATTYTAAIHIEDPDGTAADEITLVEVISDAGEVVASASTGGTVVDLSFALSSETSHYYYVRITTASGIDGLPGLTAWTAPVYTGR